MAELSPLTGLEAVTVRLSEIGAGCALTVRSDEPSRAQVARRLGLVALETFEADVDLDPWFDGVQVAATWRARVVQTCGVTLDPFPAELAGRFVIRLVPPTSPHAPAETPEVVVEPDAPDPAEVLEGSEVGVGELLVEHLAVEIDPFPKKPGAVFEPPAVEPVLSPFAVLKRPPT